jgi:hypothetical protein
MMMRTTLTLEDDVASLLDRAQRDWGGSYKDLVNHALRIGLSRLQSPPTEARVHSTRGGSLGGCLLGSLDDVSESLARAEGDAFR